MQSKIDPQRSFKLAVFLVVIVTIIGLSRFYTSQKTNSSQEMTGKTNENSEEVLKTVSCTRDSRLENKPSYDRALSLIAEKYDMWEKSGDGFGSFYFFPPKLVNCIKVNEGEVRNTSGAEGFFKFNDDQIKNDYFPITIDTDYSYNDDILNALLLVHEITHVQQYMDALNGKDNLSCIDKEAEAFFAQFRLYSIQFPEVRKSMDLRIENDKNLHPQLAMIQNIKSSMSLEGVRAKCLNNPSNKDENCIDNYRKNEIKQMLLKDDFYLKQCGL